MAIPNFNADLNIISKLDTYPNDVGGLSAAQLKAKFDESGLTLKEFINTVLIPGIMQYVGDAIVGAAIGQLPEGSITSEYLADGAVTADKLDDGAVTPDKIPQGAPKLSAPRAIDGVSFDGSADITRYGVCATDTAEAAKTVDITGFELITGARATIHFLVGSTAANPTLNISGTGAAPLRYNGAAIAADLIAAGATVDVVYDGAAYSIVGIVKTSDLTMQVFTTSGTFTAPRVGNYRVRVQGAGGAAANYGGLSGVGGGGGYAEFVAKFGKGQSIAVTINALLSSFGGFCTANAGNSNTNSNDDRAIEGGSVSLNVQGVAIKGGTGISFYYQPSSNAPSYKGIAIGGDSVMGLGAKALSNVSTGKPATGYGGGGAFRNASPGVDYSHSPGIVIVEYISEVG